MNLTQIRTFISVASNRSFAKAAKQLFITQPAISQQISRIEEELGFALLIRDRHSVQLTPAGEVFLKGAEQMIQCYDRTTSECRQLVCNQSEINVGCIGHSQLTVFPQLLRAFAESMPSVGLNAERIKPDEILPFLREGRISLLLTSFDTICDFDEITFRHLFYDQHYCVMPKDNPLSVHSVLTIDQLAGARLIVPNGAHCPRHMHLLLDKIKKTVPDISMRNGKRLDNAIAQMLVTNEMVIVPGFARPEHSSLVSIPLDDNIQIQFVAAYLNSLTPAEEAFVRTAERYYRGKAQNV